MSVVARTTPEPLSLVSGVKNQIQTIDKDLPVESEDHAQVLSESTPDGDSI